MNQVWSIWSYLITRADSVSIPSTRWWIGLWPRWGVDCWDNGSGSRFSIWIRSISVWTQSMLSADSSCSAVNFGLCWRWSRIFPESWDASAFPWQVSQILWRFGNQSNLCKQFLNFSKNSIRPWSIRLKMILTPWKNSKDFWTSNCWKNPPTGSEKVVSWRQEFLKSWMNFGGFHKTRNSSWMRCWWGKSSVPVFHPWKSVSTKSSDTTWKSAMSIKIRFRRTTSENKPWSMQNVTSLRNLRNLKKKSWLPRNA